MSKVFIIAEAGVNHNGSLDIAKELVLAAKSAGADAIKFQTFVTEENISKSAPKAKYQIENTNESESQFEMVKKLELSFKEHEELSKYCTSAGIEYMSTAFDLRSADELLKLNVKRLKIPSGEVINGPLLIKLAQSGLPIYVSTGMCTLGDIEIALGALMYGYLKMTEKPSVDLFIKLYSDPEAYKVIQEKVTLLHCTTEYPAPAEDINLNTLPTLRSTFNLKVGYSDHSTGTAVPVAAAALGATVIEKHFTLDRSMEGPDHKASLEPEMLTRMVKEIREIEIALGGSRKVVTPSELKNKDIARKSLCAARNIQKGEKFTSTNLTFKRPGSGMSPMLYWDLIDTCANQDFDIEEQIK